VFLSYAHEDEQCARTICTALEQHEFECWFSGKNLVGGTSWSGEIIQAIESSSALVVLISDLANDSNHVKREVERAVNRKLPIIPIRIQDTTPSSDLEYFISAHQWIDAFPRLNAEHLHQICTAVGYQLDRKVEPLEQSTPRVFSRGHIALALLGVGLPLGAWMYFDPSEPTPANDNSEWSRKDEEKREPIFPPPAKPQNVDGSEQLAGGDIPKRTQSDPTPPDPQQKTKQAQINPPPKREKVKSSEPKSPPNGTLAKSNPEIQPGGSDRRASTGIDGRQNHRPTVKPETQEDSKEESGDTYTGVAVLVADCIDDDCSLDNSMRKIRSELRSEVELKQPTMPPKELVRLITSEDHTTIVDLSKQAGARFVVVGTLRAQDKGRVRGYDKAGMQAHNWKLGLELTIIDVLKPEAPILAEPISNRSLEQDLRSGVEDRLVRFLKSKMDKAMKTIREALIDLTSEGA
jgi:hypothetical protein